MGNYGRNFEEITGIYSGFPLKADFLTAGTQALKKGFEENLVKAPVLKDGKVCFTLAVSEYFGDEDYLEMAGEEGYEDVKDPDEARRLLPEEAGIVYGVNVEIPVSEESGRLMVREVNGDYCVLDHEHKPMDWDEDVDVIDEDYAFEMIEAFLDAAVDAE